MSRRTAPGQLKIPLCEQEVDYSCGAAAVRSVVAYFTGRDVPEKALRAALGTTPEDGTDPSNMVEFLGRIPGLVVASRVMTIEDLRRCVDHEEVVIVDLQAWSDHKNPNYRKTWLDGHYVVLSGYEGDKFLFADPSSDKPVYLDADWLEERWHDEDDEGFRYERLGIVCSKTSPTRVAARFSLVK